VSKPTPFAKIRKIENRQVLAYTQADNDEVVMHIHYRLKNETNIQFKYTFDSIEKMDDTFKEFCAGKLDKTITKSIKSLEKQITVSRIDEEAIAE
jgi:hypothetical protein